MNGSYIPQIDFMYSDKLTPQAKAPLFAKSDVFGRQINLADYKGKKVLLGFFRHAGCPFCNMRVHTLTKVHEELKQKGLEMIFFFESPEKIIQRSTFHQEVSPIPIISDPEKEIYNAYGIEESGWKSAVGHMTGFVQNFINAKRNGLPVHPMAAGESISTIPAEFLLDENLNVKELHYSQKLTDRMSVNKIKAFASQGRMTLA